MRSWCYRHKYLRIVSEFSLRNTNCILYLKSFILLLFCVLPNYLGSANLNLLKPFTFSKNTYKNSGEHKILSLITLLLTFQQYLTVNHTVVKLSTFIKHNVFSKFFQKLLFAPSVSVQTITDNNGR